jgi:hypothetical protein
MRAVGSCELNRPKSAESSPVVAGSWESTPRRTRRVGFRFRPASRRTPPAGPLIGRPHGGTRARGSAQPSACTPSLPSTRVLLEHTLTAARTEEGSAGSLGRGTKDERRGPRATRDERIRYQEMLLGMTSSTVDDIVATFNGTRFGLLRGWFRKRLRVRWEVARTEES